MHRERLFASVSSMVASHTEQVRRTFVINLVTGRRRLIACLKSQVIFRERATSYRALLREMTHKDKASYDSTPPCHMPGRNSQKLALYQICLVKWVYSSFLRILYIYTRIKYWHIYGWVRMTVCIYTRKNIEYKYWYIYGWVRISVITGRRRCIGCLKLQVSFRGRATNHRALLRKSPVDIRYPISIRNLFQRC